jgi:hypothetical protein
MRVAIGYTGNGEPSESSMVWLPQFALGEIRCRTQWFGYDTCRVAKDSALCLQQFKHELTAP